MSDCYIIVVLFYPSDIAVCGFDDLGEEYPVILVDNTPRSTNKYDLKKAKYYLLNENKGIAYAQNVGIAKAIESGAKQIFFFDQDSVVSRDFVRRMLDAFLKLQQQDSWTAALGPTIVDKTTGVDYKHSIFIEEYAKVTTIISSGSIVSVAALQDAGWMDERLFIDLVDHEWCWRAVSKGWHIYMTNKVKLAHKVGNNVRHIFGLPFISCAPIRYYYKTRNSLWMYNKTYVPKKWKLKSKIRLALSIFLLPLINENEVWLSYRYLFKGLKDGLTPPQNN